MNRREAPILHTERLVLRPLTPEDAPALHDMFSDPQTMWFMPSLPHKMLADTQAHIKNELAHPEAVVWAICLASNNEPIGIVNYLGGTAVPGMGYIIKRAHWGEGIAAEASRAALAHGFEQLGFDQVELWIDQTNVQSHRVAEKLGFLQKGQIAQKYAHEANHHIMLTFGLWADEFYGRQSDKMKTRVFRSELVLLVHDVMETAVFYRDKLGFRIAFLYGDPPQHGGVAFGDWTGQGVSLQLSQIPAEQELGTGSYLYIFTDAQVNLLYEKFEANGVEIAHPLESYPWGMREFTIVDNNGYRLRFGTNV